MVAQFKIEQRTNLEVTYAQFYILSINYKLHDNQYTQFMPQKRKNNQTLVVNHFDNLSDLNEDQSSISSYLPRQETANDYKQSKLPYDMEQLNNDMGQMPTKNQKAYTHDLCFDIISDQLIQIGQYGYDFNFTRKIEPNRKKDKNKRSIFRASKLRFKCRNQGCPIYRQVKKENKWTTVNGVTQFSFVFTHLTVDQQFDQDWDHRNFPYKLQYHFKIYKQQCIKCGHYGHPQIYDGQIKTLAKIYSLILTQILQNSSDPTNKKLSKRQKFGDKIPNIPGNMKSAHKSQLCEACAQNKCKKRLIEQIGRQR